MIAVVAGVGLLFVATGVFQSWNLSLQILNIGILSAIMGVGGGFILVPVMLFIGWLALHALCTAVDNQLLGEAA